MFPVTVTAPAYIELHARSAFSFLRGASQPEELAKRAAALTLPAMALCDRDGVYGAPRFYSAAREHGLRAIVGAELTMEDDSVLPVLVENRTGYQNLCRLITRAKLRGTKERAPVAWHDLREFVSGLVALTGDEEGALRRSLETGDDAGALAGVRRLANVFGERNVYIEIQRHLERGEEAVNDRLVELARAERLPLLATNGVLYAERPQHQALDVFACIRNHTHLDAAGLLLSRNSERMLKPARLMRPLFADLPEALENTLSLAERLQFSLDNLGYEFPRYPAPPGESMDSFLRKVTFSGARARYTHLGPKVMSQLNRELALIEKLGFAGYFLIVWDIANFCTEHDILMQGRGSAANSAVCYSLGITACDPISNNLLFERFLSEGRKGWPDIDLDLPSGHRRESVIQELYRRYGEHGAAMTANVIAFRGRSAMREIGKALNLAPDVLGRLSGLYGGGDFPHTLDFRAHLEKGGLPRDHPRAAAFESLYGQIHGLPRHLGQHSGGMIVCQGMLDSIVPLERASMPGRVVAQWDKDDCEDLGIVKVDLLGLGMMSVLQESLEICRERGVPVEIATIPRDDPVVFEMMQKADTIGVFQIESRAQMATLPRLRPECFYDIVVEVAIIRPGPIHGDLVHPYLNRRAGREPVDYIHPLLEPVLKRTLGVPLFQEQILKMAMVIADFTGAEAEELRRALSFHRSQERMEKVIVKLRAAMERKGIGEDAIEKMIRGVTSFALYGFPESHAISFANLVWTSAWLKAHRTVEFFAGLFNNQPMGFYSPATLLRDARRHGVPFKPVSVLASDWKCTIEDEGENSADSRRSVIRLGFCMVRGLNREHAERITSERTARAFESLGDFRARVALDRDELRTLARAGALNGLARHRRDAMWKVEEAQPEDDLFSRVPKTPLVPKLHLGTQSSAKLNFASQQASESASPLGEVILSNQGGEVQLRNSEHSQVQLGNEREKAQHGNAEKTVESAYPDDESPLEPMTLPERTQADYQETGLTVGPHPMALLREGFPHIWRASDLPQARHGDRISIAGNVICRQRPGTAKGFVFISLEDETGIANAIVSPALFEKRRLTITQERYLVITGSVQSRDNTILIRATRVEALGEAQFRGAESHDFR